jgi:hypothetical protein
MNTSRKRRTWPPLARALFAATILLLPDPAFAAKTISLRNVPHYASLADAQKACGKDTVVWANLRTEVYHLSGSRWFGKTKKGAYVCAGAVTKAGVRASKE